MKSVPLGTLFIRPISYLGSLGEESNRPWEKESIYRPYPASGDGDKTLLELLGARSSIGVASVRACVLLFGDHAGSLGAALWVQSLTLPPGEDEMRHHIVMNDFRANVAHLEDLSFPPDSAPDIND